MDLLACCCTADMLSPLKILATKVPPGRSTAVVMDRAASSSCACVGYYTRALTHRYKHSFRAGACLALASSRCYRSSVMAYLPTNWLPWSCKPVTPGTGQPARAQPHMQLNRTRCQHKSEWKPVPGTRRDPRLCTLGCRYTQSCAVSVRPSCGTACRTCTYSSRSCRPVTSGAPSHTTRSAGRPWKCEMTWGRRWCS